MTIPSSWPCDKLRTKPWTKGLLSEPNQRYSMMMVQSSVQAHQTTMDNKQTDGPGFEGKEDDNYKEEKEVHKPQARRLVTRKVELSMEKKEDAEMYSL